MGMASGCKRQLGKVGWCDVGAVGESDRTPGRDRLWRPVDRAAYNVQYHSGQDC